MRDTDHHSITALIVWKCLKHLRGQSPEHRQQPSGQQQIVAAQEPRPLQGQEKHRETEFRHLAKRQRPLSITFPYDGMLANNISKASEQAESPLFKLPREIRQMIYEQLLATKVFHIVRRREKLGHTQCRAYMEPDQCVPTRCRGLKLPSGIHAGFGDGDLIQVLQSCRRVYSEAVEILYSKTVFDFDSLETVIAFSCAVLPQRLDSIRRLRLDFQFNLSVFFSECTPQNNWPRWNRTWRIIASMLALQEIQMRLSWKDFPKNEAEEERMLEPLRLVSGLKTFDLTIPLSRMNRKLDRSDMPFNIVTRT